MLRDFPDREASIKSKQLVENGALLAGKLSLLGELASGTAATFKSLESRRPGTFRHPDNESRVFANDRIIRECFSP